MRIDELLLLLLLLSFSIRMVNWTRGTKQGTSLRAPFETARIGKTTETPERAGLETAPDGKKSHQAREPGGIMQRFVSQWRASFSLSHTYTYTHAQDSEPRRSRPQAAQKRSLVQDLLDIRRQAAASGTGSVITSINSSSSTELSVQTSSPRQSFQPRIVNVSSTTAGCGRHDS